MRCKETRKKEKYTAPSTEKDFYKNALKIRKIKVIIKMVFRENSLKIRNLKERIKVDFRKNAMKIRN
jgi:hypothetical protein